MNDKYADIINLSHHVSKKHPKMTLEERSAQFAPFAALTGYGDAIKETARQTNKRIEIDEELKLELDEKLRIIKENIENMPKVSLTYFLKDDKKDGGKYIKITGKVKKIDEYKKTIIFEDSREIVIKDVIQIFII